jgi:outer membrane immunogenic protein
MHRLVVASLAAAGLSVGISAAASAADLPRPAPAPVYTKAPVAAPFSWTGCYVGGNAGYASGKSQTSYTQGGAYIGGNPPGDIAFADALGSSTINTNGFTGGGQIGCNWQTSSFVFGIEGDANYLHLRGSSAATGVLPTLGSQVSSSASVSTDYLFTFRPRVGVAVDRALFYVTGGLAAGNEKFNETFFHFASGTSESGSVSSTKAGWTAGGGIEYAFTNKWSAKVEYLYVDLGSVNFASANSGFPTFTAKNSANLKENIGRLGLNYKF